MPDKRMNAPAAILALAALLGPAQADERPREIEEIIVTAQRREENVHHVPISITTIGGELIREAALERIHDLIRYAPNVHHPSSLVTGGPVFIRGFGTAFSGTAFDPSVSFALDELPVSQVIYLSDPVYDVERFEVLRGPQGTFFGRNTVAGVFNVTSGSPTDELEGYVLGRAGGLGDHRVELALGGPLASLGESVRFRLALLETELPKDVEDTKLALDVPDLRQRAARLKLAFEPFPDLDVLLIAEATRSKAKAVDAQVKGLRESHLEFLRQYDPRFETDPFNHQSSHNRPGDVSRLSHRLQGNLRYAIGSLGALDDAAVVGVFGYTRSDSQAETSLDFDRTPADIAHVPFLPLVFDQLSGELRLSASVGAPFALGELDLLGGGLALESNFLTDQAAVAGQDIEEYLLSAAAFEVVTGQPPPGGIGFEDVNRALAALGISAPAGVDLLQGDGLRVFSDQRTTSIAFFGQVSWRPSERWSIGVGARLTHEEREARLVNDCFELGVLCAAVGAEEFRLHLDRQETNVSPRFAVQFFPSESLSLFATRASGFKSGGFNNTSTTADQVEVDSETATSWEVGAKGRLFDETLFFGATLFHMEVDDLQLQSFSGPLVVVRNAASARSRGLELDFQWLTPWRLLSIRGAGSLTDARFLEYPDAPAPGSAESRSQDLSGRRLPFAPKRQLTVTPKLEIPLPSTWPLLGTLGIDRPVLTVALDVIHRSNLYLDGDLDRQAFQDDHTLLNARLVVAAFEERWTLSLAGTNLTDAGVLDFVADNVLFPGAFNTRQEFQRSFSVELRYRW